MRPVLPTLQMSLAAIASRLDLIVGGFMYLPETICTDKRGLLTADFVHKGPSWDGGRAYYTRGMKREDCPHPEGSDDRVAWLDGWDEEAFYGGWEQTPELFLRHPSNAQGDSLPPQKENHGH
jgi:hypothetical protein